MSDAVVAQATPVAPPPGGGDAAITPGQDTPAQVAPVAVEEKPALNLSLDDDQGRAPVEGLESGPVIYETTGDPGLDLTLDFLGTRGFGPNHPAVKAAESGDFGPLRDACKALGDKAKGWERFLALGEKVYEARKAEQDKSNLELSKKISDAVGGDENWGQIREWASKNAEPAEKVQVNAAFQAGGVAAVAMAMYLGHLYAKDPNATREGKPAVQAGAPGKATAAAPMTAQAYADEVAKLSQRHGGQIEGRPEYRDLQARRSAARQAGY